MGWNSWNCWGLSRGRGKGLASARVFVDKGLRDHGWTYINIDDGWEIKGDVRRAQARPARPHPDEREVPRHEGAWATTIHALGLKFGIYSSPGPLTCGGYTASYSHELQDARSYAAWGVDYLKYDWCSYDKIAEDESRQS